MSASCRCHSAQTAPGSDLEGLLAAPGKGEGQQGSGRKAAEGRECVTQHFLFCIKLDNYSVSLILKEIK